MTISVRQLRGMTATTAAKLRSIGITRSDQLLEAARTPEGRKDLAAKTGLSSAEVLELANRADLARIKGIGEVYSNLLENCGVDTCMELARRNPENLHARLVTDAAASGVRRAPALSQVTDWIEQAKALGRGIEY